jgi:hypothetical protein
MVMVIVSVPGGVDAPVVSDVHLGGNKKACPPKAEDLVAARHHPERLSEDRFFLSFMYRTRLMKPSLRIAVRHLQQRTRRLCAWSSRKRNENQTSVPISANKIG